MKTLNATISSCILFAIIVSFAIFPVHMSAQEKGKQGSEQNKTAQPANQKEDKKSAAPSSSSSAAAATDTKQGAAGKEEAQKKEDPEKDKREEERIVKVLLYGLDDERMRGLNRIMTIKNKEIQKNLATKAVELLKNETNSEVKVKAITVLGELKFSSATPVLIDNLNDPSEDVKIAAVYALKNIKAMPAKDDLIKKFREQDLKKESNFTDALIRTLGEFNAVEIIPLAKESITETRTIKNYREILVIFLGQIDLKDQGPFLLKLYKDDEEDMIVRSYAVNSISKLGIKEASTDIKKIISEIDSYPFKKKKNYYNLYIYSVAALAKLGDSDAVPILINSLKSNNSQVRLKAATLLKDLKDKRTIDILQYKMEYDPSRKVRKAAREALKEMGVEVKEEKNDSGGDALDEE